MPQDWRALREARENAYRTAAHNYAEAARLRDEALVLCREADLAIIRALSERFGIPSEQILLGSHYQKCGVSPTACCMFLTTVDPEFCLFCHKG